MATLAQTSQTNPFSATSNSDNPVSDYDTQKKKGSFGLRVASVFLMVIPHIVTHISLGAAKGLEVSVTKPTEVLARKGSEIGKKDGDMSMCCGGVGKALGAIIGTVAAVPGLLLGTVVGITRSIYKFPSAVKTCWGDGLKTALHQTAGSYKINRRKVGVAVCTVAIITLAIPAIASLLILSPALPMLLMLLIELDKKPAPESEEKADHKDGNEVAADDENKVKADKDTTLEAE